MAEPGANFRGSNSGAWSNSSASVRSAEQEPTPAREASPGEQSHSKAKLKWRPVRGAVASTPRGHSDIQLTAGESDRYTAQHAGSPAGRGPAARTAQSQTRSVLGAQDPFEPNGETVPALSAPGGEKEVVEDPFPMTETPSTTKKIDPFGDELPPTQSSDAFPTEEPVEETEPAQPMPKSAPTRLKPETFKKTSPRSPSDHQAESNAQTDRVDCEEGRRIVQAGGLEAISLNLSQRGKSGEDYPEECPLWDEMFMARCWAETTYTWKASALCHKPLYFEDVQLERYGHEWGPLAQPVVSAAHFFVTLPILPYKMGLETPNECVYALGYYRPNSCAPYMIEPLGFTWRAALFEAGAVVGTAAVLP